MSTVVRTLKIVHADGYIEDATLPVKTDLDNEILAAKDHDLQKNEISSILQQTFSDHLITKDEQLIVQALAAASKYGNGISKVLYSDPYDSFETEIKIDSSVQSEVSQTILDELATTTPNHVSEAVQNILTKSHQVRMLPGKLQTEVHSLLSIDEPLSTQNVHMLCQSIKTVRTLDVQLVEDLIQVIAEKQFTQPNDIKKLTGAIQSRRKDISPLLEERIILKKLTDVTKHMMAHPKQLGEPELLKLYSLLSINGYPGPALQVYAQKIATSNVFPEKLRAPLQTYLANLPTMEKKNWSLFVYINADNNLHSFGKSDIEEMEQGFAEIAKYMNVVVLADGSDVYDSDMVSFQWDGKTRVFLIEQNEEGAGKAKELVVPANFKLGRMLQENQGELNLGTQETLEAGLDFFSQIAPSIGSSVVLWNHGLGWRGVSWDDNGPTKEYLDMPELRAALGSSLKPIDVLGFDACLMQQMAVSGSLSGLGIQYLVASEETEPAQGWNYKRVFNRLAPVVSLEPTEESAKQSAAFAEALVDSFSDGTLSAIDVKTIPHFITSMNELAKTILDEGGKVDLRFQIALRATLMFKMEGSVDAGDFLQQLMKQYAPETGVYKKAQACLDELHNVIDASIAPPQYEKATGLAVYMPESTGWYKKQFEIDNEFWLKNAPDWLELVKASAYPPPAVI